MHRLEQFLVVVFVESVSVDTQLLQQANRFLAVVAGCFDGLCTAVSQQQTIPGSELVAFGMTAEVIMIVED